MNFYINHCDHTRMLVLAMWIINVRNCEESSKLFTYRHHQFQIEVHIVGSK